MTLTSLYLRTGVVLLLISTLFISSWAQSPPGTITLEACIQKALQFHPSMAQYRKKLQSEHYRTKSLRAEILPSLNSIWRASGYRFSDYSYGQTELLADFLWDAARWRSRLIQLGLVEEQIIREEARLNRLRLIYQVKEAYYRLQKAKNERAIAQLGVQYLKHHLEVAQKLFSLGQIDRMDLFQTESVLAAAREKVLQAQTDCLSWVARLNSLTGLSLSPSDSLVSEKEKKLPELPPLEQLLETAKENNPSLKMVAQEEKKLYLQEMGIRSNWWPVLHFGGGYVVDRDPTSAGNHALIYGRIQLPLWDWGQRRNQAGAFRSATESTQAKYRTFWLTLQTQLAVLYQQIGQLKELIELKGQTVRQAQKAYDYTEMSYRGGAVSNTDVLLAQKYLMEAKSSLEEARLAYYLLQAQLYFLLGKQE